MLSPSILALLSGAFLASPSDDTASVSAPPIVTHDVPENAHERIDAAWRDGLGLAGATLVDPAAASPCADTSCLQALTGDDARYAAGLTVNKDGRDWSLRIVLVDRRGRTTELTAECAICGFDEVAQLARDKALSLESKLAATVPGQLDVATQPPGARVIIDGEAVGTAPFSASLREGEHHIRVELDGHFPAEASVTVVGGAVDKRRFALEAVPPPGRDRPKWIAGWTLLGVGIGTLGGGIAFFAYHHRDVVGRCDQAENLDVNGTCRYRYDSLTPAIALTTVGAAIAAAGVALVVVGRRDKAPAAASAFRITPAVGLGSIHLRGRF